MYDDGPQIPFVGSAYKEKVPWGINLSFLRSSSTDDKATLHLSF